MITIHRPEVGPITGAMKHLSPWIAIAGWRPRGSKMTCAASPQLNLAADVSLTSRRPGMYIKRKSTGVISEAESPSWGRKAVACGTHFEASADEYNEYVAAEKAKAEAPEPKVNKTKTKKRPAVAAPADEAKDGVTADG